MVDWWLWLLIGIFGLVAVAVFISGLTVITPHERGLVIILGKFKRVLEPGRSVVPPLVSRVVRIDMRSQRLTIPPLDLLTKDKNRIGFEGTITIKVVDPVKASFEVQDYRQTTVSLMQTTLRSVLGDIRAHEIETKQPMINDHILRIVNDVVERWGVVITDLALTIHKGRI